MKRIIVSIFALGALTTGVAAGERANDQMDQVVAGTGGMDAAVDVGNPPETVLDTLPTPDEYPPEGVPDIDVPDTDNPPGTVLDSLPAGADMGG